MQIKHAQWLVLVTMGLPLAGWGASNDAPSRKGEVYGEDFGVIEACCSIDENKKL
ncbi:MAG TPA: hypothetical protein PLE48_15020 [Thiobacillus sp.]|nr:hypothetical protein [Thiobacillus sp.]